MAANVGTHTFTVDEEYKLLFEYLAWLYMNNRVTQKELALVYNCSQSLINRALSRAADRIYDLLRGRIKDQSDWLYILVPGVPDFINDKTILMLATLYSIYRRSTSDGKQRRLIQEFHLESFADWILGTSARKYGMVSHSY